LHQVGDLFELNAKLRCQKVKYIILPKPSVGDGIRDFGLQLDHAWSVFGTNDVLRLHCIISAKH